MIELLLTCFLQTSVVGLFWQIEGVEVVNVKSVSMTNEQNETDFLHAVALMGDKGVTFESNAFIAEDRYMKVTLSMRASEGESIRLPHLRGKIQNNCPEIRWRKAKDSLK